MNCINCGTEVSSKFCPDCGQKTTVKRITLKEGWLDFWARIYGFDGMFPRTLRDVTLRPGVATRAFIAGNRTLYYGPVGYFFLMITLILLVMSLVDINLIDFLKDGNGLSPLHPKVRTDDNALISTVLRFISDYIKFITFLIIPIQAFSARYILFRKSNLNFVEHSILPFYIQGHLYWLTILKVLDYKFFGGLIPNVLMVTVSLFYFGYAYSNFIQYQAKWKVFLKGLGVFIIAQGIFILLIASVILVMMWLNRGFYEMIKSVNNP